MTSPEIKTFFDKWNVSRWFKATLSVAGFLISVYLPAFAIASGLGISISLQIPLVIATTTALASGWAFLLVRFGTFRIREFGLNRPHLRSLVFTAAIAIPIALAIALLSQHANESGPLAGLTLPPALLWLYFAIGAPIQEEWIFRGLLQAAATRVLAGGDTPSAQAAIGGSVLVATVFGLVHLSVGPWTAAAALLLGLLAGEARRRSNSVLPAILIHSIFNIGGLLLALH
ncbi:MAG: CPBP family intramembrane glutamic endopeptidase [Gammaproteobacteria bacterium]